MAFMKRKYTCSECAKTFKNAEDMHMHAEACLLDAFEMEAHALITNQGYPSSNAESNNIGKLANDYQTLFKPYTVQKKLRSQNTTRRSGQPFDPIDELEFEDDYDSDCPPELELAEPQHKKYRRIFPVGEDGKQIRPKMECPTCGLVLYRHNFSTHYRIHTGELPFTCSFCDKRFRTSSALTVHTRCHTGDKPYMCPHCDYCCITKRNLDRHIINNHVKRRRVYVDSSGVAVAPRRRQAGRAFYYAPEGYTDATTNGTDHDDDDDDEEEGGQADDAMDEEEELDDLDEGVEPGERFLGDECLGDEGDGTAPPLMALVEEDEH